MIRPKQPEPLSLLEAAIPVVALIALVGLSYFLFGDGGAGGPNQVALVVATMIAVFIGWRRGHDVEALGKAASDSVATGIGAIFILFAVGALIGTWALSGTLVAMVYYGLQLLSPNYFYFTACAISAVVAFSIGSSWTVVGTIGVGFMGIAVSMELNPAIAAGAIISGAYFGDKSSPLSDSANLSAAAAGVPLYTHIRETLLTSIASLAISLTVFFFLRFRARPGHFFGSIGLALGFVGSAAMTWLGFVKFVLGESIGSRPLFLIAVLLLVFSIQFLTTGLIAEMLSRVFYQRTEGPLTVANGAVGDERGSWARLPAPGAHPALPANEADRDRA